MGKGAFAKPSQKDRKEAAAAARRAEEEASSVADMARLNIRAAAPAFVPGQGFLRASAPTFVIPGEKASLGAGAGPHPPVNSNEAISSAVPAPVAEEPAVDVSSLDQGGRDTLAEDLLRRLSASESAADRTRIVRDFVALIESSGVRGLWQFGLLRTMKAVLTDASNLSACEGFLQLFTALISHASLGRGFEPFALELLLPLLELAGHNKSIPVRTAAAAASMAYVTRLCPAATPVVLPVLLAATAAAGGSWRSKLAALELLSGITAKAPAQMGRLLPDLIPVVAERLWDTRPEVKAAATALLTSAAAAIANDDVRPLGPALVGAMARPDTETGRCLELLLHTTFIAQVDSPTLALLVPLLSRALRSAGGAGGGGGAAQTRKAARVVKNMAELVLDPADAGPFMPLLLPALERELGVCVQEEVVGVLREARAALLKAAGAAAAAAAAAADATGTVVP